MLKKIVFMVLTILIIPASWCHASHGWFLYHEGSFKGIVFDAETKKPIEDAVVVGIYYINLCGPLFMPECGTDPVDFKESLTKKDGSFYIYPHVFMHPWPFTLGGDESRFVIFKAGYKLFETGSKKLQSKKEIALEPVPATYYPRHEELEKAKDIYGVEWQKTRLLKDIIAKEENVLTSLDRYPDGVFFHAFADERNALISPADIAVDKNYIYVGDGFTDMGVHFLDTNGNYLGKELFVRGDRTGGVVSGGTVAIASKDEERVWGFTHDCLKEFSWVRKYRYWGGRPVYCYSTKGDFPYSLKRFKVGEGGNIYAVTEELSSTSFILNSFLILNMDGKALYEYKSDYFTDVVLDYEDYSYVAFRNYEHPGQYTAGIIKLNKEATPVGRVELSVYTEYLNITNDNSGRIYLSFKDSIEVYDGNLDYIESLNIKSPRLGEISIAGIVVDMEGNYLYAIDRKYNRILKYDLKNRKLAPRLKKAPQ